MIGTTSPFPAVWSYLFPIGAQFRPAVTTDPDGRRSTGDRSDVVLIGTDRSLAARDLSKVAGLLVLDPGRGFKVRLHRRGFTYLREFAVVPGMDDPRWLIPLDSGAVARGAFQLQTPYRAVSRAKHAVARATAVTLLPFWRTPKIVVALRSDSPLERVVCQQLGSTAMRLGLSSGTPGGFPKPSFVIISGSGEAVGFGKIGDAPIRRRALENESQALSHLARTEALRQAVPRVIFAGDVDGRFVLLTGPLKGSPGPRAFTEEHRRFLKLMPSGRVRPLTSSNFVQSMANRMETLGGRPRELAIWQRFRQKLEGVELVAVNVHGDFAPWNLRRHSGRIGALDWEWWSPDGLPLVDEVHHRLQVGFLLDRWGIDRGFAELAALASSRPAGLAPAPACALISVGLLDYFLRIIEDGYAEEGSLAVPYGQLVTRMLASLDSFSQR